MPSTCCYGWVPHATCICIAMPAASLAMPDALGWRMVATLRPYPQQHHHGGTHTPALDGHHCAVPLSVQVGTCTPYGTR